MSLESELRTHILADGGVSVLIGTRYYPNRLPDNPTLPAVVYSRITTNHNLASGHVPLVRCRMQIDAWSDSYADVVAIGEALHTALDMIAPTGLQAVIPEDDDDSYDTDAQLHRRRLDVWVWRNQ